MRPYSSTRSVAELTIAEIIMLARKAVDSSCSMHQGRWKKSAVGSKEVRGKTLGIVGYGHIGQQVGLLAEAIGMEVFFYDQIRKLPLGRAEQVETLEELLTKSDFVSLHVPALEYQLIGKHELELMRKGSYLLNFSRGTTVDLKALRVAILSEHIAGTAIDVYPSEPKTNDESFNCELSGLENVILTPHLGGSTEEAQYKIANEVTSTLIHFVNSGTTIGAVNFPQVNLPEVHSSHRILNVHKNVPGVLSDVNRIIADLGANIDAQYLSTY
jgi:D-3-phosphoglycerate dehydrogenase / 2-oxoglutarate reductase